MRVDIDSILQSISIETDPIVQSKLIINAVREGIRPVQIAKKLKRTPSHISHLIRLQKLPPVIINGFYDKTISLGHLFNISRLEKESDMMHIFENVLSKSISTNQTERLVSSIISEDTSNDTKVKKEVRDHIVDFFSHIDKQITATIHQTRRSARIEIQVNGKLSVTNEILNKIKSELKKDL